MSILNLPGGFGLMALIKGFSTDSVARNSTPVVRRQIEIPVTRRVRVAPIPQVYEPARFEDEDCERWDGMA